VTTGTTGDAAVRGVASHNGAVDPEPASTDAEQPTPPGAVAGSDEPRRVELADDPAEIDAMRAERAQRRMRQTVRDMLLSMLVVTAIVLVFAQPWNRPPAEVVTVVDPAPVIAAARESLPWQVLAPTGLPPTWRCTSARFDLAGDGEQIVHLGYLSETDRYTGLEQSATRVLSFVPDMTLSGVEAGSAQIDGATWTRYETADGRRRSLVRADSGVTYVVSGNGDWAEVVRFADSLSAG
jgi:hypothetical protein